MTDATANTSPNVRQAWLIHHISTLRQNANKWLKTAQRRYKGNCNGDKDICYAITNLYKKYVYNNCPPIKPSTTDQLAFLSYSKWIAQNLVLQNHRSFPKYNIRQQNGISDTASIKPKILAWTMTTVQDVVASSNNCNEYESPNASMP